MSKTHPISPIPNKDTPKTRPILHLNHRRRTFRGVCFCALHGYVQNQPGFIFPHPDTPKTHPILDPNRRRETFRGVCFCAPTRVRAKPARFHISAHGYTKNAPHFTLPNKDTPKTRSVLGLNRRRETFRGVCNTPLHVYVQNPPSFIFPHMYPPKTHPISSSPIRIRQKPARF